MAPEITSVKIADIGEDVLARFMEEMANLHRTAAEVKNGMANYSTAPESAIAYAAPLEGASHAAKSPPVGQNALILPSLGPNTQADAYDQYIQQQQQRQAQAQQAAAAQEAAQQQQQLAERGLVQKGIDRAAALPLVGPMVSHATDEQGFFTKESIGQALAYSTSTAALNSFGGTAQNMLAVGNPLGYASQGMAQGLPGGEVVNLPFGLGFRNPFSGEAFQAQKDSAVSAITGALPGGVNFGQSMAAQMGWQALGYRPGEGTDSEQLANFERDLITAHPEIAAMIEEGPGRSLMDQMVRHGTTSLDDVATLMGDLGTTAESARIPLNDFVEGINAVSESLSTSGLTKFQGARAATDFSAITGLHPQVMQQLMENPLWQAQAMAQTQLPPEMQGLLAQSPGGFQDVTAGMLDQLRSTIAGVPGQRTIQHPGWVEHISSRRQEDAMISNLTGIPLDTLRDLETNPKTKSIQGNLESGFKQYSEEAKRLANRYGEDSPQYIKRMQELAAGTGRYKGQELSLADLDKLAHKKKSGLDDEDWRQIMSSKDPKDQLNKLRDIVQSHEPGKIGADSNKHMIGFTGMAEKVLKEVLPGMAGRTNRPANQGKAAKNGEYTQSQINNIADILSQGAQGAQLPPWMQ